MIAPRIATLALSLGALWACGGRYERNPPDADDPPSQGGSSSNGTAGANPSGAAGAISSPSGGTSTGCPTVTCARDERVVSDGRGCQECGHDPNVCGVRQDDYDDFRAKLIAEFENVGCMQDQDCRAFYDQSDCDPQCFRVATAAPRGVVDRLNLFKLMTCRPECVTQPSPLCPTAEAPHCVNGRCL